MRDFMRENRLKEFDAVEFRCYEALKLLEDKSLTPIKRAKLIAQLVKGQDSE